MGRGFVQPGGGRAETPAPSAGEPLQRHAWPPEAHHQDAVWGRDDGGGTPLHPDSGKGTTPPLTHIPTHSTLLWCTHGVPHLSLHTVWCFCGVNGVILWCGVCECMGAHVYIICVCVCVWNVSDCLSFRFLFLRKCYIYSFLFFPLVFSFICSVFPKILFIKHMTYIGILSPGLSLKEKEDGF